MKHHEATIVFVLKLCCIPLISIIFGLSQAQKDEYLGPQEKRILDTILDTKYYDKHFRPARTNGTEATVVSNWIQVHSNFRLDDTTNQLLIDFTLHQEWQDDRLKFSNLNSEIQDLNAPYSAVDSIWVPDTHIKEDVLSNTVDLQSVRNFRTARLFPDGRVLYSKRILGNLKCPSDSYFYTYPHDLVECPLRLTSYAYSKDDLILEWSNKELMQLDNKDSGNAKIYEAIVTPGQVSCNRLDHNLHPNTTSASCIEATFYLQRNCSPFVKLIYVPTIMLVIVSYLSFFLHPVKMSTPRALVALVPFTIGVIMTLLLSSRLPQDSKVKAIDVWTGTALTFLFTSVLEFTIVSCLCRLTYSGQEEEKDEIYEELPTVLKKFNKKQKKRCSEAEKDLVYTKCAVWTDYATRVLYPTLFVSFCFLYWLLFVSPPIPLN